MGDKTAIEWTEATWNTIHGCTRVSPGCDHCYIDRSPPFRIAGIKFDGEGEGSTTGVTLRPQAMDRPLRWTRGRRIFVNSLSDLFHADVPDAYIAEMFAVMRLTPHHTFQILTKRPGRMRSLLNRDGFRARIADTAWLMAHGETDVKVPPALADAYVEQVRDAITGDGRLPWPLPNVWMGVTVEDQRAADLRIPLLLDTPAAVRFLSCEPLLGPVHLGLDAHNGTPPLIDWIIAGGESGPEARPMHPDWARQIRDDAVQHGAAFHFKQWGEWLPFDQDRGIHDGPVEVGKRRIVSFDGAWFRRVGKHYAGRRLDGRTWDEFPS